MKPILQRKKYEKVFLFRTFLLTIRDILYILNIYNMNGRRRSYGYHYKQYKYQADLRTDCNTDKTTNYVGKLKRWRDASLHAGFSKGVAH